MQQLCELGELLELGERRLAKWRNLGLVVLLVVPAAADCCRGC